MPGMITVILFATIVVNSLMILFLSTVTAQFRRSIKSFVMSAIFANLWALGALLILVSPLNSLGGFGRLLFLIAPMWVMYWLVLFAENYPGGSILSQRTRHLALGTVLISSVVVGYFAETLISETTQLSNGVYQATVAALPYTAYGLFFALFSSLYSYSFWQKIHRTHGTRRKQIWFAYAGMLTSSFVAFGTNLFLPVLGVSQFVWAGPASSFIYAVSYAFAIRRYRLFDVRRFAARAAVYIVALVTLVFIYAFVMGVIRSVLEQVLKTPVSSDLFYTIMTVVAVFLYEPLKRIFDRFTKRVFFKNDYEIQDVIDKLGGVLLRAGSRDEIESRAMRLLRSTLLVEHATIVLRSDVTDQAKDLSEHVSGSRLGVIAVDSDSAPAAIVTWMRDNDTEVIARINAQSKELGWVVLGPKRSGNGYTDSDLALINIACDEIAIAIANTLQYEQIQEFNVTLQDNVKSATSELRSTNKRLRAIDATKDEFISMASHQLRTPLTSIKGYISMMLEGDLGEIAPAQRKALEEAYNSSQRMVYLIGDFLNLSRLQTGRFELERTDVSLPQIIQEEIAQLRATAQARSVVLNYDPPSDFPTISVDENKIRQVMMNFIDNAIYYAKPNGGEITVSLINHPHHVTFRVRDNGIGVPASEKPHLFTKFYRAGNARKARPDGTGIGLYMAKKVIVAHGGSIVFTSKEGEGSEFGFRLPHNDAK